MRINPRKLLDKLSMQFTQLLQTKIDSLVAVVLIVVVNLIAFLNVECCIMVFLVLPVMLSSYYIYCAKKCARSAFIFIEEFF